MSNALNQLKIGLERVKSSFYLKEFKKISILDIVAAEENVLNKCQDYIKAYMLLTYAEMQSYFQEISKEVIFSCLKKFKEKNVIELPLIALVVFTKREFSLLLDTFDEKERKKFKECENDYSKRLNLSVELYIGIIENDINGIKRKDIFKMLMPLGFLESDFDNDFLIKMDDFGSTRGEMAHKSCAIKQEKNFDEEVRKIDEIMQYIRDIDEKLSKYIQKKEEKDNILHMSNEQQLKKEISLKKVA